MKSPKLKWIMGGAVALCLVVCFKVFHVNVNLRAGNYGDDLNVADAEVDRFHTQFNNGQFQAIYDEANPVFQKTGSQSALVAAMTRAKQIFGDADTPVLYASNTFPGGQVRFVYHTKFHKGAATEFFVLQSDGQAASLMSYRIVPGTLKSKAHP